MAFQIAGKTFRGQNFVPASERFFLRLLLLIPSLVLLTFSKKPVPASKFNRFEAYSTATL
jgi:hypothetical protein